MIDEKQLPRSGTNNMTTVVASVSVLVALMTVLNFLAIPVPAPVEYFGFAPVLVLTVGILLKPKWAFLVCSLGSVLGQLLATFFVTGYISDLPAFLLGAFVARGLEGLLISSLAQFFVRGKGLAARARYTRETAIMVIGGIWEVFGYAIVGVPYYVFVYGFEPVIALGWYLVVFIDMVHVPIALAVIIAIRRAFGKNYLDGILFKDTSLSE